jgi:CBS domain-containing protein
MSLRFDRSSREGSTVSGYAARVLEVARFLAAHPPFRGLAEGKVDEIARSVAVEFFPTGSVILQQGGAPSEYLYVLRRGAVELCDGPVAVDLVEEGEPFGFPSLLSGSPPRYGVRVREDALCYLLDRSVAAEVFGAPTGIRFLIESLRDGRTATVRDVAPVGAIPAGSVARSPLVIVDPDEPVVAVAERMTAVSATAAVVALAGGPGIVTDRDFRARVVAGEVDLGRRIADVATTRAATIDADAPTAEALLRMLELGVHHLPVVGADGAVVAMLGDLDLLGLERRDAFRLRSEIQHAAGIEEVAGVGRRLPAAVATLVGAGVDAEHVARVVSVLVDALTVRLLELAGERLGPVPVPYAWLALGSAGRREQALVTDQDHALVYADGGEDHDGHFRALAEVVASGLETAGIARCSSKVMAGEEGWRGSESWWRRRMSEWVTEPDRVATFLTGIAFDVRVVTGDLDPRGLFVEAAERAPDHPDFLRRLARLAIELRPPIGFLGGLVVRDVDDQEGVLDLKLGGLLPVTELARLFALEAGSFEVGTVGRLRAAASAGTLEADQAEGLEEAFRLFHDLRLRHQVQKWEAGEPPGNLLDPDGLGPIERGALKQAFRIVRDVQNSLAERLAPRILGR